MIFPGKSQQGGNNVKSGQLSRAGAMHMASDQLRPGAILDSTRAASWLIVYMASARLALHVDLLSFKDKHKVTEEYVSPCLA